MFILALLIGIYSYLIFALGLVGGLDNRNIVWITIEFLVLITLLGLRKKMSLGKPNLSWVSWVLIVLLMLQLTVNLIGALGPELGFDALWYHLTIPKIWLQHHKIFFIDDGRYYYSALPKLVDMLYLSALSMGNEIWAKIIHCAFGVGTLFVTYKLARKWMNQEYSLLSTVIFYSNLVVGWQSITAYIDLGRTFFEVLALYLLVNKSTLKSALALGLSLSTKILAIGSMPIYLLITYLQTKSLKSTTLFALVCLAVPLPWLVFSFINTGNPIYPIFSEYDMSSIQHIFDLLTIFIRSSDPLNPIYLLVFPAIIFWRKKLPQTLVFYCIASLVIWWLIPRTGGGRFVLPYLPAWSVLTGFIVSQTEDHFVRRCLVGAVILISLISITYRTMANIKYLPAIIGSQTKQQFLDNNLNHYFGENNFYMDNPLQ